jgi:hypothetical protein
MERNTQDMKKCMRKRMGKSLLTTRKGKKLTPGPMILAPISHTDCQTAHPYEMVIGGD